MHLEQALNLAQALNNRLGESLSATNLSLVYHDLGDANHAKMYAEHAHRIDRSIGDKEGEGYSLTSLALAYEIGQEWQAAQKAHQEALFIRNNIGQDACAIDNVSGLARASLKQENLVEAERFADQALEWIHVNGTDGIEYPLRVLLSCADVYSAVDEREKAATAVSLAADLLEKRAARISDEAARRSYLENVPLHQELRKYVRN